MLVKHVRDVNRNPIATVVGEDNGRVGLAVCSVKDNYNKRIGITIASGRARSENFDANDFIIRRCPTRFINVYDEDKIENILREEYHIMKNRLERSKENSCG